MPDLSHRPCNTLLAGLPEHESARLWIGMNKVLLAGGQVIHEAALLQRSVYFPLDCIVSQLYLLPNGGSDEIAVIGYEGLAGLTAINGSGSSPHRSVVRRRGEAVRVASSFLLDQLPRTPVLQARLSRYSQALLIQVAQLAVCNRHHSVSQQLCRWLMMALDRLPSSELLITHEQIAGMLGVRREGITAAAGKLQQAGIIHYSRGCIQVLDRAALAGAACECRDVVRREWQRLFPHAGVVEDRDHTSASIVTRRPRPLRAVAAAGR